MTSPTEDSVRVSAEGIELEGTLTIPAQPKGSVLFAHGSGSSRFSSRNRTVAKSLQGGGFATLLLDLLSAEEEAVDVRTLKFRFDIPLLASRLVAAVDWLKDHPQLSKLKVGLFGASTGAGAALIAAAERPDEVAAVVSRGGRPDLAGAALQRVRAPTLLLVGERDDQVIRLNRQALEHLRAEKELSIVPGATHLFEEPGALEKVAEQAGAWFERYLD